MKKTYTPGDIVRFRERMEKSFRTLERDCDDYAFVTGGAGADEIIVLAGGLAAALAEGYSGFSTDLKNAELIRAAAQRLSKLVAQCRGAGRE